MGDRLKFHEMLMYVHNHPKAGKKKVAKEIGIAPGTAKRWMESADFKDLLVGLKFYGIKE